MFTSLNTCLIIKLVKQLLLWSSSNHSSTSLASVTVRLFEIGLDYNQEHDTTTLFNLICMGPRIINHQKSNPRTYWFLRALKALTYMRTGSYCRAAAHARAVASLATDDIDRSYGYYVLSELKNRGLFGGPDGVQCFRDERHILLVSGRGVVTVDTIPSSSSQTLAGCEVPMPGVNFYLIKAARLGNLFARQKLSVSIFEGITHSLPKQSATLETKHFSNKKNAGPPYRRVQSACSVIFGPRDLGFPEDTADRGDNKNDNSHDNIVKSSHNNNATTLEQIAFAWTNDCVRLGQLRQSILQLSRCHLLGLGTKIDVERAVTIMYDYQMFFKTAHAKVSEYCHLMGMLHLHHTKTLVESYHWFVHASNMDHAESCYELYHLLKPNTPYFPKFEPLTSVSPSHSQSSSSSLSFGSLTGNQSTPSSEMICKYLTQRWSAKEIQSAIEYESHIADQYLEKAHYLHHPLAASHLKSEWLANHDRKDESPLQELISMIENSSNPGNGNNNNTCIIPKSDKEAAPPLITQIVNLITSPEFTSDDKYCFVSILIRMKQDETDVSVLKYNIVAAESRIKRAGNVSLRNPFTSWLVIDHDCDHNKRQDNSSRHSAYARSQVTSESKSLALYYKMEKHLQERNSTELLIWVFDKPNLAQNFAMICYYYSVRIGRRHRFKQRIYGELEMHLQSLHDKYPFCKGIQ